jgi:excisionase family DNA binding protein
MEQRSETLMTLRDAAAVLRLHPETVRQRIVAGELEALRLGKRGHRIRAAFASRGLWLGIRYRYG